MPVAPAPSAPPVGEAPADHLDEAARLRLAVVRLGRQVRRRMPAEVTATQLSALAAIEVHGPVRPADLADHEGISRSTTTRLVAGLERAGWVERSPDPEDGRACLLALTSAGRELRTDVRGRATAYLATRLAEVEASPEDVARACDLLERLVGTAHHAADGTVAP